MWTRRSSRAARRCAWTSKRWRCRSLNGKKAWQVDLPKTVKLALSSDRGDDPFAKGEINFTDDPAAYQLTNIETSNEESYARAQLTEAWDKPSTKGYALDSNEIT